MDKSHKETFYNYVNKYAAMNENDFSSLFNLFHIKKYNASDYVVKPETEKSIVFFIFSGLIRYYYLSEDGKEWNRGFIQEGTMCTTIPKEYLRKFSPYGIQAMEDSVLLIADFHEFELLYNQIPMVERLGRKVIESILISKMNREHSFLQQSAKMRYIDFLEQYPLISTRVPQYHIASYLGITEVSLSRIIKEMN